MNLFVLNCLFVVVQVLVLFFSSYHFLLWIVSLFVKEKYKKHLINNEHSFTFLICCHNEEIVIGDIIKSVQSLDYPTELYDIYVICDNCDLTDRSEEISLSLGARTIVRHNKKEVGKGYGVDYALNHLWSLEDFKSDGIVILDADNLVSQNFLIEINKRFNLKEEVIQVMIETKNIFDSWITKSSAISFWNSSVFFQQVRYKLGLSSQLCGTGMVFKTDVLRTYGFNCNSLAEDMEFSALYPLETKNKIHFCKETYVLDEKPLKLKESYNQRLRWVLAHWNLAIKLSPKLLLNVFNLKNGFIVFDNLIYLIQPMKIILSSTLLLISYSEYFFSVQSIVPYYFWLILFFVFIFQNVYSMIVYGHGKYLHWIFKAYVFSLTWIPLTFHGFLKRNKRIWSHTKHTRTTELIKKDLTVNNKPNLPLLETNKNNV